MIVLKNILIIVLGLLIVAGSIIGCAGNYTENEANGPEIKTDITLGSITAEEYESIIHIIKGKEVFREDFIKLHVDVKIVNSLKAQEREIMIPDIYSILNNEGQIRALMGGAGAVNNLGVEAEAHSFAYVIFDGRDLTVESIKKLIDPLDIYVSWVTEDGRKVEKHISIGDELNGQLASNNVETINSTDDFVQQLKIIGYEVKEIIPQGKKHTFFSEYPRYFDVDNNRVTVYEFPDIETAKSHSSGISSDGYNIIPGENSPYIEVNIQWSEKPYFYQKNRLIVNHTISDETFLADLEKILDKPITE